MGIAPARFNGTNGTNGANVMSGKSWKMWKMWKNGKGGKNGKSLISIGLEIVRLDECGTIGLTNAV